MAAEIICNCCGTANPLAESYCENCGAQLNVGQTPGPILLNQRYRVLNELGKGGFGAVYRVEDTQFANRFLAAKKLHASNISSPHELQEAIDALKREAQLLSQLKHPNLPTIYDSCTENGDYYLIMDLISGETLEEHRMKLGQGLLPISEVLKIGIELATVLDYLHTRTPPIIFRDLKPSNIMLTPEGQIYLIDFGIARLFKPGQRGDTVKIGTEGYASPEHYKETEQTTPRSDIYTLGAVLHELLSGDVPSIPFQFAPLKLTGKPQTTFINLVMNMLKLDPQQRPANAAKVKQELQQILQELQQPTQTSATQARSAATFASNARPTPQKKPGIVPSVSPAPPPPPKPRVQGELCYSYTHSSQKVRALAWSPDGTRLAAAGEEPVQISLWPALTNQAVSTYAVHTRPVNALAWSPDSRFLVSGGNESVARIWQPGQSPHQEYSGHKRWIQALAWSPDGQLIASGSDDKQVHLWEAATGLQRLIYRGHGEPILALAWSPDGARIASADERGSVQVWEVASGKTITFYKGHAKDVSALAWSPDGQQIVSGSWDGTLQLWEASSGQLRLTYDGHQRMITAVAWSPASGQIASAGKDQSVQLWQPHSGDTLYTYRGHTNNINALAWSPDGNYLASAGVGEKGHVWWTK